MLKIRLNSRFRVVVAETRSRRDGAPVATLGSYNPKEKKLTLDQEKYRLWLSRGAKPSEGLAKLLKLT